MVCPRRMSFSQFVVHMSTTNCEKDSLLGQTIPSPEPFLFFENPWFFLVTFYVVECLNNDKLETSIMESSIVEYFVGFKMKFFPSC